MTIDQLISKLQIEKEAHGGDSTIYIRDADTSWHLRVSGVRESNNEAGKVLIIPEDYSEYNDR